MATSRKRKSAATLGERDPRERFVSLANSRVTAAIHQIRLIGNLSNKKNYQYSPEDAAKIIRALQRELDELKSKFKGESKSESSIFSL
jgi:ABC-type Fe3+-hydroxamate transport system substrate-binding protein